MRGSVYSLARILCILMFFCLILAPYLTLPAGAAEPLEVAVGIPVEEHPELFSPRSMPTHGEGKIAVFLIDFPDHRNENPEATVEYYDNMYFNGGVETFWGYKTVAEVYREHSYGKLNLSGKVFDWYTAKHERSYYDDTKTELVQRRRNITLRRGVTFLNLTATVTVCLMPSYITLLERFLRVDTPLGIRE